jgi:hypothetical protein
MFRRNAAHLILAVALMGAADVSAATFVVDTFDLDAGDTNTALAGCDANPILAGDQCTLRAAITQANATAGPDLIVLPLESVVTLTSAGLGDLGDLDITAPVTITGLLLGTPEDVSRLPRIVGANGERLFDVASLGVTLQGLRLEGGDAGASNGGALRIAAGSTVEVDRVRFQDNDAQSGGAISNAGVLEVVDSDFTRNRSVEGGSAISSSGFLTVRGSSFRNLRDVPSLGNADAIRTSAGAALVFENSTIDGTPDATDPTDTGGITASSPGFVRIRNSTFSGFTEYGLFIAPVAASDVIIANSMVSDSGINDCQVNLQPGAGEDTVRIGNTLVGFGNCLEFGETGTLGQFPPLLGLMVGSSGSVTFHRTQPFASRGVDTGQTFDNGPLGLEFACLPTDARGNSRPLDGNADGDAQCDMGAVESSALQAATYVVNVYDVDLPDANPGVPACDVDPFTPGPQCTLRAAVMQANAKAGPDLIEFADGGEDVLELAIAPGAEPNAAAGDLDITEQVVISGRTQDGRAQTTITQTMGDRLFDIATPLGQTVRLTGLRLVGGTSPVAGGALRIGGDPQEVSIADSVLTGNSAPVGGAIATTARLKLEDVDMHGNQAGSEGAAIRAEGTTVLVFRSSLWDNTANDATASRRSAIFFDDGGLLWIENSTLSGNSGGAWARDGRTLVVASTFIGNQVHALRIEEDAFAELELRSSVLAGSGGTDCSLAGGPAANVANYNLIEDGSCAGATNLSGDPGLAPALARLDGMTSRVHLPLLGSVVLDAVPDNSIDCPDEDQRERQRPFDTLPLNGLPPACEIGALEMASTEINPNDFLVDFYGDDRVDNSPGDSICDAFALPGLQCTLRAAVMEANALPGASTITIQGIDGDPADIVLDIPAEAGPASAAHGDLDILGPTVITSPANPATRRRVVASHGDRIFNVSVAGDDVTIRGLRLSGGNTSGSGGAVRIVNADDVRLERIEFSGNVAELGGGAVSALAGNVEILDSDLVGNGTVGEGAAIRNQATLVLERSSVRENLDLSASREAIHAAAGSLTAIYNSTITGNSGDGVRIEGGTLAVENSNLVDNELLGIRFGTAADQTLFVANSVLVGNGDGSCALAGGFGFNLSTDRYNFASGNSCAFQLGASNLDATQDPLLGPLLAPDDAWSAYYLPAQQSPLVDGGSLQASGAGCLGEDQLGAARTVDGNGDGVTRCDVGSIERTFVALGDSIFGDGFEE